MSAPLPDRWRENVVHRVSDLIGHTPLFHLGATGAGSRLLLKLENLNPTGSAKVRMASQMIAAAERRGELRRGGRIVEPTSGNTGLGLALAALERGYRFTAVVDHHASIDKMRALIALGAELVWVGEAGTDGPQTMARRALAEKLAREDGTWWPDQHNHPGNPEGYRGLACELLGDLFGDVDYLVASVGTGGGLCGTTRELRRLGSGVRSVGVEPTGSIMFGGEPGKYWQTGGGNPADFPVGRNVDHALIDEGVSVGDVEAFATARVLARHTGLLVGGTAGGAVYAALERLATLPPRSTVVVLVSDAGEKYLDTLFDEHWLSERGLHDPDRERSVGRSLEALTVGTGRAGGEVA
ncbi:cysteine synthase family protein [Actinomycetospora sp.]|uniref:PLP-dependent cysteine synthase family protein n=1 Tax=Actinomycetospora sp. TaxID=1872135 RepID=UPI002F3EC109